MQDESRGATDDRFPMIRVLEIDFPKVSILEVDSPIVRVLAFTRSELRSHWF